MFWGIVKYNDDVLKKGNKIQVKDKIEPQHIPQTQLEPPDKNWPITSHIKDKGISAITLLACSIANKKQGHLLKIQFKNLQPWLNFNLLCKNPDKCFLQEISLLPHRDFNPEPLGNSSFSD